MKDYLAHWLTALALIAGTSAGGALAAQDVERTATLTRRGNESYRSIASVRELAAGDLLISDPEAGILWRAPRAGERRNAVSSGAVGLPGLLRAGRGDSTFVYDRKETIFSILTPDGRAVAAPASLTPPATDRKIISPLSDLYQADGEGRLYWVENTRDSTSPLKRRSLNGTIETVATLRNAPMQTIREGGIGFSAATPFAPIDDWAMNDAGHVVLVRGSPYRIDRPTIAGASPGPVRMVAPVSVTAADKAENARARQKALGSINLGGATINTAIPDDAYPKTKGAFSRGAIRVAPDGQVWVIRAIASEAALQLVDIFTAEGVYRETLSLPRGANIVGFGAGVAFITLPVPNREEVTLHTVPR